MFHQVLHFRLLALRPHGDTPEHDGCPVPVVLCIVQQVRVALFLQEQMMFTRLPFCGGSGGSWVLSCSLWEGQQDFSTCQKKSPFIN